MQTSAKWIPLSIYFQGEQVTTLDFLTTLYALRGPEFVQCYANLVLNIHFINQAINLYLPAVRLAGPCRF